MEALANTKSIQMKKINFEYAFRPVYYFKRIAGLWPFSIIHDSNGTIQRAHIGVLDILWSTLIICLNLLLAVDSYEKLKAEKENPAIRIRVVVENIFETTSLLFIAIGIVLDVINRNKLVDILRKFNIFDNEVSKFGVLFNHKRDYQRAWLYLITPMLILLLLTIIEVLVWQEGFLSTLYHFGYDVLHFVVWILVVITFIFFTRSLYERFAALNRLLGNRFLNGNTLKVSVKVYRKASIDIIKFVGYQHTFLTDIMDQLNVCYAFQVLISTAATFINLVMSLHVYCNYILYPREEIAIESWIYTGSLLMHITGTIMIIYYSSLLTKEGKRTFRIVHDIINCCNDSNLMHSLHYLSQQCKHRRPIVTCGLFTFDWTLLYNIIAATVTYLIIVLNFENTQGKY